MLKSYNKQAELDKDILTSDDDFIADATAFLRERTGTQKAMTSDQVFDEFMEHMRFQDSNEVTAYRDYEYAQNADLEGKQRFGRLIDAYDKVDDLSLRMVGDYAEAIAKAPSTYLGILSGGSGKVATVAATQAAKLATRRVLSGALQKSASSGIAGRVTGAMAVEGAIGTGQGAIQEATRVETGIQEEFTGGRTIATGVGSALGAGLINLAPAAVGAKGLGLGKLVGGETAEKIDKAAGESIPFSKMQQDKAAEMLEKARISQRETAEKASEESKKVIKQNKTKANAVKKTLEALNVDDISKGRKLKKDLKPSKYAEMGLAPEVIENISAATIRIGDELGVDLINKEKGERVTTKMFNLMRDPEGNVGKIKEIQNILRTHNLTMDEFSLAYMAEISEAGRILNAQSQLSRLFKDVDELHQQGMSAVSKREAKQFMETGTSKVLAGVRDFDKFSVGVMTVQPATTMRNTIGGGFRLAIESTNRLMSNGIEVATGKRNPKNLFSGTTDIAKYMLNPAEGRVIRTLMEEAFPVEMKNLFRQAADIEGRAANEGALTGIARKMNVLNTASDNMFKQAVLAASLRKRLADKGKNLDELITSGRIKDIDSDVFEGAVKDAYSFTYQEGFRGPDAISGFTRGFIGLQEKFPLVFSAFMPFPRFVANQLKFQYEHLPIFALTDAVVRPDKAFTKEAFSKRLTGAAMLGAAYAWRIQQGPNAEWYEIKRDEDTYVNGKAIYGPVAPFMVIADIMYRLSEGTMPKNWGKYYQRAALEATLGSTFRTGLGLAAAQRVFEATVTGRTEKEIGEAIGTYLSRYTIPAGAVKDLYSQFDPNSRLIPTTSTGEEENMFDYIYKSTTRTLPDFPLYSWSFGNIKTRDYDTPAVSPFQTGPLKAISPIEKQLFGATNLKKSALQKEMSRLGMTYTDLYTQDKDTKIDFYTRQELSRAGAEYNMNEKLKKLIRTKEYQSSSSARQQRLLKNYAQDYKEDAKKAAIARVRGEAKRKGKAYSRVEMSTWDNADKLIKEEINRIFVEEYGGTSVEEDADRTIYIGDRKINVLLWAVSSINRLKPILQGNDE
jgi:hypothetical protein